MIEGYLLEPRIWRWCSCSSTVRSGRHRSTSRCSTGCENGVPHTVVATKTDKVRSSQRQRRKRELADGCPLDLGDVVSVSATKGGRPRPAALP